MTTDEQPLCSDGLPPDPTEGEIQESIYQYESMVPFIDPPREKYYSYKTFSSM
ncbi:MAG: hypothetical protein ACRD6U_07900 [Nitrososphaeraceae archaeon]